MSSTTVAATPPVATKHIIRKAAMFTTALAVTSAGMWFGAQAVTAHMNQPTSNVSYANQDAIARTLHGANHTPATAGDFIDAASIQTADVVSAVKVAN